MTRCEKKIQAVTDTQSDIIENCHQQQIKMKDHKKETEKLTTQSQQFTKDLRDALVNNAATNKQMGALDGEIKALKEILEVLSTRFEEYGSSLEELSTRFEEHGSSLEELSTRFEEHGSLLDVLSTRFEEYGSSLKELTKRNDESLKALSTAQKSESRKLEKLEEKLSALENSWRETTVENGKLCQDVETKVIYMHAVLTLL
jgi:chromosome segregation ATPase